MSANENKIVNEVDMETETCEEDVSYSALIKENEELKANNAKLIRALNKALDMIGKNYAQSVAAQLLKDED